MTFDDIPLLEAIYDVRREMDEADECPGSDSWTSDESKRVELTRRLLAKLILNVNQRMIDAWIGFRKTGDADGRKKAELIVEVARAHGSRCFYADRGLGQCSNDVDLDRLVPGARGGRYSVENCVIACGRHNRSRGDANIEDLLQRKDVDS